MSCYNVSLHLASSLDSPKQQQKRKTAGGLGFQQQIIITGWREALNPVALISWTPHLAVCLSAAGSKASNNRLYYTEILLHYLLWLVPFPGCTPQKCGRAVTDAVVTREEAQVLRRYTLFFLIVFFFPFTVHYLCSAAESFLNAVCRLTRRLAERGLALAGSEGGVSISPN